MVKSTKIYKNFNIKSLHKNSIILIGNFDGIHKNEIEENGIEKTSKSYEAICNYIQSELKW